jgi:hypothetical protein
MRARYLVAAGVISIMEMRFAGASRCSQHPFAQTQREAIMLIPLGYRLVGCGSSSKADLHGTA